jgi:hypothetical protein
MKIEVIEILIVCAIFAIQLYVFIRTFKQIRLFKNIIPEVNYLFVSKILVPVADLQTLSPKELLDNINRYKNSTVVAPQYLPIDEFNNQDSTTSFFEQSYQEKTIAKTEVNIIESHAETNEVFDNILFSVNNYLIRNRGAASDFNLIKDIIERNIDAIEEDINLSLGIPLYLGLMGTMLGIVIGLFNMPDLGAVVDTQAKDLLLNEGIALLIGGVKIAMIASFCGLLFTIINSGWIFKGSRSFSEARKNKLYTFVQIELLPIINHGLASTLESLQRNLLKFNDEFSTNLKGLTGVFDASRSAIREQKELLEVLDKAKVSDMTRYNVAVLKQLDVSVQQFEKFNGHIGNVNQFVENSQLLVSRTADLLDRTDSLKTVGDNIGIRLDESKLLVNFLSEHFNKLEDHKAFTANAVADVGHTISETFKELKEHIQNSSEAVKRFTVDETESLKAALSSSRTNLGNLEYLATLKSDVSHFKSSSASQGEQLKQAIVDLNKNMVKSVKVLEQIEKVTVDNKPKSFASSVKNLFTSKK